MSLSDDLEKRVGKVTWFDYRLNFTLIDNVQE